MQRRNRRATIRRVGKNARELPGRAVTFRMIIGAEGGTDVAVVRGGVLMGNLAKWTGSGGATNVTIPMLASLTHEEV